ncbi:hypothetical protein SAY87_026035 [Trapa incisa]|uniref:Uncharacterized protein n=1 Tax=Trapa incisa TaxID=236973 RepID=A0AAN7GLI0_9MYRT|nr:hypothetical protein SAY87_026035 [Trapa incisa]
MGRRPCCAKEGLNRGTWSAMEDEILINYIKLHGEGKWRDLPHRAGLKRCGKSCRLRWLNYLRPNIKRGDISEDEEELIIRLHNLLGNRWALIAGRLPGRTDNEIKNYWNTYLSKRVRKNDGVEQVKLIGKRSVASHQVIRTKAVRCTNTAFPRPPLGIMEESGHGTCTSPTVYGNPPPSRHLKTDIDSNFLFDFHLDELLHPNTLLGSNALTCLGQVSLREHEGERDMDLQVDGMPVARPSWVPCSKFVEDEHPDLNRDTCNFESFFASLLSAVDSEKFGP